MPTLRTVLSDPMEIERRLLPRDDLLVRESEARPGVLVADAGPFAVWERRLVTEGNSTTETLRYSMAVPHWAWLVERLLRRPIRTGVEAGSRPFWSPSNRLSERDVTVLGLCATLSLIAGFLGGLVGTMLTYIVDDLGGGTDTQANALAIIRAGAVLTFVATALADRRGRRPLMAWCLVIAAVASILTAFAPNVDTVIALQLVTRGLVAGAAFLIPIVCAEEIPAGSRAYAVGMMALPGGLGVGMVLWTVPIMKASPTAWRAVFLLAIVALVAAIRTARRLPESRRFVHDDRVPAEHEHQHMRPSRLALLGIGLFLLNLYVAPTQQLQNDYLKNTRGFGPLMLPAFLLLTNTWGFIGIAAGAQLADRYSRRLAATIGVLALAIGNTVMFHYSGWLMWMGSLFGSMVGAVTVPAMGALLPELFPTLRRGAANGLLNGAAVIGSIVGLVIAGRTVVDGNYGPTVAALALGPLILAVMVWWLPETAGVELETLNPDD